MIRLAFYITLAISLALGAVWLADNPGSLLINWQGREIRMTVAIFGLLILLYTVFCWHIFKLYRWFGADNPLKSPKRMESRRQKGLAELDLGWSAFAIQDRAAALKHGKKARRLLPLDNGPLRLLLHVSAGKAREDYLGLLEKNPNSKLTALKFRLDKAASAQDSSPKNSLAILQEMRKLQPGNIWISRKIFDISTQLHHWAEAKQELSRLGKGKAIDAETQKHLSSVINYCQALEADLSGQKKSACDFALQALKNAPAFTPAALLLARIYLAQGEKSKARKLIETTWKICPHPDLGQFFLDLEPMESPSEKFRRIQKFMALNDNALHSLHLMAKVSLDTAHWGEAKQALEKILTGNMATQETYHLLSRLEILQKNDQQAAEAHRASAAGAAPDPVWHCGACGVTQKNYVTNCPDCHAFDSIIWQGPS
ncbi:MAG: hypothetical protein L3J58_03165 [Emcibacter sp.]|nr:hypothetical protein [Emcibacter sp.]